MRDNDMTTKLIRVTTVPQSLWFCSGLVRELVDEGYEVVAVSSPGDDLTRFGEQEGVRTIAVPMERRISPMKDLKSLWRMWRVLRRERPDMVHSMTPKAGLVTMLAGWLARVPVRIHTFTGLVFPTSTGLKRRLLMATDWLTCACATHVIPEGEGVKADLLNHGITHKPLKVLGYGNIKGVDLDHWSREAVEDNAQCIMHNAHPQPLPFVKGEGKCLKNLPFVKGERKWMPLLPSGLCLWGALWGTKASMSWWRHSSGCMTSCPAPS